ncbi:MAG: DUF6364 family protein [Ferruginibacter sp.]
MKTKLTLSVDEEKVKQIKHYAKQNGISVSKFLEKQIDTIIAEKPKKKLDITRLKGVFGKLPDNFNWKKDKTNRLIKKYVK